MDAMPSVDHKREAGRQKCTAEDSHHPQRGMDRAARVVDQAQGEQEDGPSGTNEGNPEKKRGSAVYGDLAVRRMTSEFDPLIGLYAGLFHDAGVVIWARDELCRWTLYWIQLTQESVN